MQHDPPRSLSDYDLRPGSKVDLLRSSDMPFDSYRQDKHDGTNRFLLSLKLKKSYSRKKPSSE